MRSLATSSQCVRACQIPRPLHANNHDSSQSMYPPLCASRGVSGSSCQGKSKASEQQGNALDPGRGTLACQTERGHNLDTPPAALRREVAGEEEAATRPMCRRARTPGRRAVETRDVTLAVEGRPPLAPASQGPPHHHPPLATRVRTRPGSLNREGHAPGLHSPSPSPSRILLRDHVEASWQRPSPRRGSKPRRPAEARRLRCRIRRHWLPGGRRGVYCRYRRRRLRRWSQRRLWQGFRQRRWVWAPAWVVVRVPSAQAPTWGRRGSCRPVGVVPAWRPVGAAPAFMSTEMLARVPPAQAPAWEPTRVLKWVSSAQSPARGPA